MSPFAFVTTLVLYVAWCVRPSNPRIYPKLAGFVAVLGATSFALSRLGGVFPGATDDVFESVAYGLHEVRGFFDVAAEHNGTAGRYYFLDTAFVLAGYADVRYSLTNRYEYLSPRPPSDVQRLRTTGVRYVWPRPTPSRKWKRRSAST